jgi:hypothetical protein
MLVKILSKNNFRIILFAYVLAQIFLVMFINLPFYSDSLTYYNLAQDCLKFHSFYPGVHNIYDSYIIAPVYVNWVYIILSVYNSPTTIFIVNIALNMLQLMVLMKIAKLIFKDEVSSRIVGIIYILYIASLGAILMNYTELLFGVLFLSAYYFYLKKGKKHLLLSGILIGLAIGVRQIGFGLIIAILINEFIQWKNFKKVNKEIFVLILSMFVVLICLGLTAKIRTGYYVSTGTNEAVNILMGAHDNANGSYKDLVFQKGNAGYLQNENSYTYFYKSDYWNDKAFQWITSHPFKWLSLIPYKIFHTVAVDDWSVFSLTGSSDLNLYKIVKGLFSSKDLSEIFANKSSMFIFWFLVIYLYHHLFYYVIFVLMLYCFGINLSSKNKSNLRIFVIPYIFSIICFAAIAVAVGAPRYKYSVVIILMITIVPYIKERINKDVIESYATSLK